jgi:DNA mismatch repair protein MutL
MLMVGRYPVAVLLIHVQPEDVDVNVHPAKAQVRFRHQDAVFSAIQRAVRKTLIEQAPAPAARAEILWGTAEWEARRQRLTQIAAERTTQLGLSFDDDYQSGRFSQQREDQTEPSDKPTKAQPKPRTLPMMRVVGQVGGTYIVSEGPQGLYLIDQHAAHERVLFEQFLADGVGQGYASQELLEPVAVELAPDQMALLEEGLAELEIIGFKVEIFGRNTARILALPVLVVQTEPVEALLGALSDIECGEMPTEATREQRLISRVCKQAAVKAGQTLSYSEMEGLVRQLEKCNAPQTCPHGRPTMLHISAEELAKQFGRLGAI